MSFPEETKPSLDTKESPKVTMELRGRKRPKLESTPVNGFRALSPAGVNAPGSFCYDSGGALSADGSNADCALFRLRQFEKCSALNDTLPSAMKQIGIMSPKNPAKNGWLSHHNGYHNILLTCSNGLTAPVVKVNGLAPRRADDACCRASSRRRGLRTGRACRRDTEKVVNAKEAGDVAEDNLFSQSCLGALEEKAPQDSASPDVVAGSRSERALGDGLDPPTGIWSTGHCPQQPKGFRKFSSLCKEKASTPASSVSSASERSCVTGIRKERVTCRWSDCGTDVEVDVLLEHIARAHVDCQAERAAEETKFVCLWSGCKFYNRGSVLKTWLERHVHCHLGDKPYRCIVAQCRMRFSSQFLLNRHINGHFSGLQSRPLRKGDALQKKKRPRNAKPCPVKTDDFFDSSTMESVQNELVRCVQFTQGNALHSGNTITFQSYTLAKRVDSIGRPETLLRWWPKNILPDEWVPESQVASYATKVLPVSRLPGDVLQCLLAPLQPQHFACHPRVKKHRK